MPNHTGKKQSGGKILGKGRDGCVVDPPLMCSSSMNKLNKISKLINVSDVSAEQYQDYVNEYESGKIFRKHDPDNKHFLPGIDMCEISENEKRVSKSMKKDIKKCGYKKKGKETYMLNIIMKKGKDFPDITEKLSGRNFLKSLAYILHGAKQCIYDMNILLLDIKGPNLLYSQDDGSDDTYPVFIDFSDDFVIKNKSQFLNFIQSFGRSQLPYYDTWSFEILVLFYAEFTAKNSQNETWVGEAINNYFDEIEQSRGIDLDSTNGENMMNAVVQYVNKETKTLNGLYGVYNKIMMYSIGKTYYRAFRNNSKVRKDKNIENILLGLIDEDIHTRFYADDALAQIGKLIKYKNRGDLLIKPSSSAKKLIEKKLQVKKLLQQAVKAQQKKKSPPGLKKKSPPLPSNLRMSPMTPLSFRQHVSQKPKKIVKKVKKVKKPGQWKKKLSKKDSMPALVKKSKKSSMPPLVNKSKTPGSNCMKMKVVDIKKSKAYKALKLKGKAKLKKKELCAVLQKKSSSKKSLDSYTKDQLKDIIKNKRNC